MANIWKFLRGIFGGRPLETIRDQDISKATLTYVHEDDPEIKAAWQQARATAVEFIAALRDPDHEASDFYVKKRFEQGDRVEHIWLSDVQVEGQEFIGRVGNDPQVVSKVKFGDEARVAIDDISDWMIMRGEDTLGGFTVQPLMKRRENG